MIKKNQIDNFILKEAFKYLFEEESSDDVESLEDTIEQLKVRQKQNLEDIKTYTEKKRDADKNKGALSDDTDKKIADLESKKYKERLKVANEDKKTLEDSLKKNEELKSQSLKSKSQISSQVQENKINEAVQANPIQKIKQSTVTAQQNPVASKVSNFATPSQQKPAVKKKDLIVRFDTNTANPFTVKFTNRGFLIGNTRLSFELLDKAVSKNFSITLENGFVLTPIKMQKVLKYKDRI